MLSKAKGQVLRVAAALHVLSGDCEGKIVMSDTIADTISEDTLLAAKNFVITCCQHAAYVAGRGKIEDEIDSLLSTGKIDIDSKYNYIDSTFRCRFQKKKKVV